MEEPQKMAPEEVADRLIGMGWFKFMPDADHRLARQEFITALSHGYLGTECEHGIHCLECPPDWRVADHTSRDRRIYQVDAEDLAEGGIGDEILAMRAVLSREGVTFQSANDEYSYPQHGKVNSEQVLQKYYDVVIDGQKYRIHDPEIISTIGFRLWDHAMKRLLEIVNERLKGAGSSERLYGFGETSSNVSFVVLLTDEMYALLKASRLLNELPYPSSAL